MASTGIAAYDMGGRSAAVASRRLRGRFEIFLAKRASVECMGLYDYRGWRDSGPKRKFRYAAMFSTVLT